MDKQTQKKTYQTPKLEVQKKFVILTGVSLPIGGILGEDEGTGQ